jgi:hypothetical protein
MKSYEDIPNSNGMKVLRDVPYIGSGFTGNVVIRNITEDYWNEVIQVAETPNKRTRVCAVGTAGIGKTVSTAVLIRLLLRKNRTVVYHKRSHDRSGTVYEFTPVPATDATPFAVKVNVILASDFEYANFESLTQEDGPPNYYVVDRGSTIDNCCPNRMFKGRFILVSSPDERCWGESEFLKARGDTGGAFRFFPMWSLDELMAARPFMDRWGDISDNDIKERYRQMGGEPSEVFSFDDGNLGRERQANILDRQRRAMSRLSSHQRMAIACVGWNDTSTFSPNQPICDIMGYGQSGDDFSVENAIPVSETVHEMLVAEGESWLRRSY